jgi:hypothetical protein
MSDIPEEYREPIYIREQIERIDRLREEARRLGSPHDLSKTAR